MPEGVSNSSAMPSGTKLPVGSPKSDASSVKVTNLNATATMGDNRGSDDAVCSELLCFVQQKCDIIAVDQLVRVCADFYKADEILAARTLLNMYISKRLPKRQGADKLRTTMEDVLKVCLDPSVPVPTFYAVDLSRLPPVDMEHCDVSAILKELHALRQEVRELAELRAEVASLRAHQPPATSDYTVQLSQDIKQLQAQHLELVGRVDAVLTSGDLRRDGSSNAARDRPGDQSIAEQESVVGESPIDYVAVARQLQSTGMRPRVRQAATGARKPVIGLSKNDSGKIVSVDTRRTVDLFVSRYLPHTPTGEVRECVANILGGHPSEQIVCTQLKSRYEGAYASFHVAVSVSASSMKQALDSLMSPDLWPAGLLVRRYFHPKK